jgi:hypothetical protein
MQTYKELHMAALALGTLGGEMAQIGLGSGRVMPFKVASASADPVTIMCSLAFYFAELFDYAK